MCKIECVWATHFPLTVVTDIFALISVEDGNYPYSAIIMH